MLDILSTGVVMLGNDSRQGLSDNQVYIVADTIERPAAFTISLGPNLTDSREGGVTVTLDDLRDALAHYGYAIVRGRWGS